VGFARLVREREHGKRAATGRPYEGGNLLMATNHTPNYSLSQWEAGDQFSREDFNSDFAKIDSALKGLEDRKAAGSSVSSLASRVTALEAGIGKKADKTALASAEAAMVRIASGQYTGDGRYGSGNPRALDFSSTLGRPPQFLVIRKRGSDGEGLVLLHGMTSSMWHLGGTYGSGGINTVSWSGNKVSWYAESSGSMFNTSGEVYLYFAIG